MIRGIQSAASGMIAQLAGQEAIANNLANANTAGFKRDVPSFAAVLSGAAGAAPVAEVSSQSAADFAQGALMQTGDKFNLAIEGQGFFTVQTAGGIAYTRDGAFTLSKDGYLSTLSGDKVLGANGPVKIGSGDFAVSDRGEISQGNSVIAKLRIEKPYDPTAMTKLGSNLWSAGGAAPAADDKSRISQGYLESSNVNAIHEMVSMITGYRTFEASQKVIQAQDETLDKLVNDVGRVG